MSEDKEQLAEFTKMVERIVQLANEMKDEGKSLSMINGALMSASATYGSYVAAGNDGYLQPSGVDKLVEVYRNHVNRVQEMKLHTIESEGKDTDSK
ncbi:MAG: DUF3144 domain-containing protein [Candidatus Thiodiazotropha sp. (ex Ustalcina ferruginea)]|nr:DUF3144 domain-containing protein [Candidatus Thiodiazotropha sp. (ex Ustalcina ferruginea)]